MMRAVIFDMDGVICDSEPLHLRAFQSVLQEEGIQLLDNDYYEKYLAFDDRGCFSGVFAEHGRTIDPQKMKNLLARKARYFDVDMKEKLMIYPGAESFVKKCADRFPIALASGARRLEVEFVLRKAKLRGLFAAIVSADDVKKGKPDPETFQRALSIMNDVRLQGTEAILPSQCLVIEDSKHGIAAAHAAGMKCAAVTTSYKAPELSQANSIIESLVGLELEKLEKLFV
jgi:HAD superfamily hydrolase (TIGR01509 family)